jgi:hypothetical protein
LQRVARLQRDPRNNLLKQSLRRSDLPRAVLDSQVAAVAVAVGAGEAAVDGSRQLLKHLPRPQSRDPHLRRQPNLKNRRTLQEAILLALQKM